MVKIRLARGGAKNSPFYRIVAITSTRKRGGKPLEILGFWNPATNEKKVDKKEIENWVQKGAQISDSVKVLMEK